MSTTALTSDQITSTFDNLALKQQYLENSAMQVFLERTATRMKEMKIGAR